MSNFRQWLFINLDASAWPKVGLSPMNRLIVVVVLASVFTVVLETEETISQPLSSYFRVLNFCFAGLFTLEYLGRLWVAGLIPRYSGFKGRVRYILSLWSLFDLLAIVPYYMSPYLTLIGITGSDAFLFRTARLVRIISLARIGRFGEALSVLVRCVWQRRHELYVTMALTGLILLIASTVMYLCEKQAQPEAFGSILRSLWWGVITLTTVGYGDVYPITPIGKFFAGVFAFAAIGLIAMPTGILAAAFSDAFQARKESS